MHQPYTRMCHSGTPAHILFLIDVSWSMRLPMDEVRSRIEVVRQALQTATRSMVARSEHGDRYEVCLMQYAEGVSDVTGGFVPISGFANDFLPDLTIQPLEQNTHTAHAFETAFLVFREEIEDWTDYPAPVLCHITDGEFNDRDPTPAAERIRHLAVDDGNVLICNTFIALDVLGEPVRDARLWRGVTRRTSLGSRYARTLRDMSSDLPASYREVMRSEGYSMREDAVMMVPGVSAELIRLALVMAQSTPYRGPA